MTSFFISFAVIATLTTVQHAAADDFSNANNTKLLETIFDLMTDDEFDFVDTVTANLSITDFSNLSQWEETEGLEVWDAVYSAAESMCDGLNLSSSGCYSDCLYYNFIPNWIPLMMSNHSEDTALIMQLMSWYSVSAGPISWNDAGNVDMCQYYEGTYCYTPATISGLTANQHGCCVPGSCTGADAEKVLSANSWCYGSFESYSRSIGGLEVTMSCDPMERDMKVTGAWTTIVIFFLFFGCIVIASVLKRWCIQFGNVDVDEVDSNPFIKLFDIQNIWSAFGRTRKKEHSSTNFIDGFKVFSMTWVLVGHAFLVYTKVEIPSNFLTIGFTAMTENKEYHFKAQDFYLIFIQYAPYSVDTFYFFSGLLGTWSIHRFIKKVGNRPLVYIPMSYLARFLRIVPMMMFVTLIWMTLLDQMAYGYHVSSRTTFYEMCSDQWYKILFFYLNLTDDIECMGHLWYLQCDMQMFLLLPILMWIFTKSKIWGIVSSFVPVVVCLIIRFVYGFYYEFTANQHFAAYEPANGGNRGLDSYFKPWTWMSGYFMAVALAMVMIIIDEQPKSQTFVLRAWQYWSCMLMAAFIMSSVVMWPYQDVKDLPDGRWGKTANSMYYALSRPAWQVALALMTVALKYIDEDTENNGNGQKSMVKALLSLEMWQPLNKLTYIMYLLHFILMFWWMMDLEVPTYYDEWSVVLYFIAMWFLTAVSGLILWFVMEKPLANMVTMFMAWILGFGRKRSSIAKYEAVEQPVVEVETVESSEKKEHSPYGTLSVNRA